MNWTEILKTILETVVLGLVGLATAYLTAWLRMKKQEVLSKTKDETTKKYVEMLDKTVYECVMATNQTYVDALKKDGLFTAEAQKEAFNRTFTAVKAVITNDAQVYLNEAVKDLDAYITNKIESDIKILK